MPYAWYLEETVIEHGSVQPAIAYPTSFELCQCPTQGTLHVVKSSRLNLVKYQILTKLNGKAEVPQEAF